MAKFLLRAKYTSQGIKGAVKEGFAAREKYVTGLIDTLGGKTEAWYYAYGPDDVIIIVDAEPTATQAISLAINQSGSVELTITPLITSAELDQARRKLPDYRAPGA
jgi:uncharacterized protein with GYD domain